MRKFSGMAYIRSHIKFYPQFFIPNSQDVAHNPICWIFVPSWRALSVSFLCCEFSETCPSGQRNLFWRMLIASHSVRFSPFREDGRSREQIFPACHLLSPASSSTRLFSPFPFWFNDWDFRLSDGEMLNSIGQTSFVFLRHPEQSRESPIPWDRILDHFIPSGPLFYFASWSKMTWSS